MKAFTVTGGVTTSTDWGPIGTFEVTDLPPVTGQRIALDGQALDEDTACHAALGATPAQDQICLGVPATPVLDWDSVPGAGLYMVYLGNDRELTNRLYTASKTSNSRWTPTAAMNIEALADNQSGESYYWYIRPCKTLTVCGPDPISTDRAATTRSRRSHRASSSRTRLRTRSTSVSTPRTAWSAPTTSRSRGRTTTTPTRRCRSQVAATRRTRRR